MTSNEFNETLRDFYAKNARNDLPWRQPEPSGGFEPYKVLVSEIMLQQTQVARVVPKYAGWMKAFPDIESLAKASLSDVLKQWSGLGYNRRAKFLHESAKQIVSIGEFPNSQSELIKLSGVGVNTAGAILAYAFNQPVVFIETNIRTVFLYHFFANQNDIADTELLPLITQMIDQEHPREWYWALMDYGSYLKQTNGNHARASKHHALQSKFSGSRRQVRGQIIKLLTSRDAVTFLELSQSIDYDRLAGVLDDLCVEGLIAQQQGRFSLAE